MELSLQGLELRVATVLASAVSALVSCRLSAVNHERLACRLCVPLAVHPLRLTTGYAYIKTKSSEIVRQQIAAQDLSRAAICPNGLQVALFPQFPLCDVERFAERHRPGNLGDRLDGSATTRYASRLAVLAVRLDLPGQRL